MDRLETLATIHESFLNLLIALIRVAPEFILRTIANVRGHDFEVETTFRERHPNFEVPAFIRRAHRRPVDALLTLHDPGGAIILALVLEFQDCTDFGKRRIWPQVTTTAAAEFRVDAEMLVFAISQHVRGWLRSLLPGLSPAPMLVEAHHVERIVDLEQSRQRPLVTIFSGVYHARTDSPVDERVAGIRATLVALTCLDERDRQRYSVLVSLTVPTEMLEQAKQQLVEAGELTQEQHDEALDREIRDCYAFGFGHREGLQQGREQGREQGCCTALTRALLDILDLRGVSLTPAQRERIYACDDLERIERWYERAKSDPIDSLAALFSGR